MLSFQTLYNKCITYSSDSVNTAFFKAAINEGQKITENELDNFVVEDTRTGNTIAALNTIPSPENYIRAKFLYVTSGNLRYDAQFVYSEEQWQTIVAALPTQSNYLRYAFPRPDTIELYPTPASILPYTLQYVSEFRDMQYDDYSAGTVSTITNTTPLLALPYATVVGTGTPAWTAAMAGRYFKMNSDSQWYKITSVTNSTTLVLAKAYAGLTVGSLPSAGYTIAEMPRLPEAAHVLLYYYALKEYYAGPKKDAANLKKFSDLYDKWMAWSKGTFNRRTEMGVIPSQRGIRRLRGRNPNLFPRSIDGN